MPTTYGTVTSTVIVIATILAIVNVLKEQHVHVSLSLPLSESNKLDAMLSLSAALL
jgi:hypothetical protein